VVQHSGTALSYLNLFDADAAWRLVHELASGDDRAVAIIKHANPCGVAVAGELALAYTRALECDPVSAFGGVVALGGPCTTAVAREVAAGPQADVIVAPAWEPEAIDILVARRKTTRLLEAPPYAGAAREIRSLGGGYLLQDADRFESTPAQWKVVTKAVPTADQWRDVEVAWRVCARTASNAVVVVASGQAVGIGAGQQSRVESAEIAVRKAGERAVGAVAASDAFFPFRDGFDVLASAGVAVVIQPGGSVRDGDVVAAADEHGTAMVITSERHFRH
jgi:phosphoribosylaminoimidazolecarboxamide formyltransferase/IMP cyclohydrolase